MSSENYKEKYLKYKNKYVEFKQFLLNGGSAKSSTKKFIIIGTGGGFDIFGALPKILEIIRNNTNPHIVVISNSFAHTGYAKLARDNYKSNCEDNPRNITLLNNDTLITFVTNKCYKIIDFTSSTPDLNTYHPEGFMFKLLRDLNKTSAFTFDVYNIFGWIRYPKNEPLVSRISEPATFNETYIALQKIIIPLSSSDYEIMLQDCGCDILINEDILLNTDLKYGMGSQYEEMKIVASINLLINNLILDPKKIKICAINLGGDLAGRYTEYLLSLYSRNVKLWLKDQYVEENFKLLEGTSADSFANISMKACYDKYTLGDVKYIEIINKDDNIKRTFDSNIKQDIINDTLFMLKNYPDNLAIKRILSVDLEGKQKVLSLPLTIKNQLTELIIPWSEYKYPKYIESFDAFKDLHFKEYHKWVDKHYEDLLKKHMTEEMKNFVEYLHYNYRWSSWSKSFDDIYDYNKGMYINNDFASDQFKKTTNIWTWSSDTKSWSNSNNIEIKLNN